MKREIGPNGFIVYTNNTVAKIRGFTWGIEPLPMFYAVQGMVHADYEASMEEIALALREQIIIRKGEYPGLFG